MKSDHLKRIVVSLVVLVIFSVIGSIQPVYGQAAPSTNAPPMQGTLDTPAYAPGEVLVKFRDDVTDPQIADAFRGASLQMVKQIQTPLMRQRGDIGITRTRTAMPVEQAVALLNRLPGIEYAQPNWIYKRQADITMNDPYFMDGLLWGLYGNLSLPANTYGSKAAEAWAAGSAGSKDVYIGVIDSGIQFDHPDLAANIWKNPGEIPGDGSDNDGNDYVDDIYGWNAVGDNGIIYDLGADEHGTHVAGTIGAAGGNSSGVVGVNWSVKIISGKFLGPDGYGDTVDAIEAIQYMTVLKQKGINIVALNNSWGGGAYDAALLAAIVDAAKEGILFVAAAGNGNWMGRAVNTDRTPYYPACYITSTAGYDAVISVTAIDSFGAKPVWANYGSTTVDLGAPGVDIYSSLPYNSYDKYSGTSMATPHVTGAIALYAAKYPGATAQSIKAALLASTTITPSLSSTVTKGRLDIGKFLGGSITPSQAPTPPSSFVATALSPKQIKLSWQDNSDNETEFKITRTGNNSTKIITVPANVTSYTDDGLTPGTEYVYSLVARNVLGSVESPVVLPNPGYITTLGIPSTTAKAIPVAGGPDTDTKGNWVGKYGKEGYDIVKYKSYPNYADITISGPQVAEPWLVSLDERALKIPLPNTLDRFAACYYRSGEFYFDVSLTDGKPHRVSLYCADMDRLGRIQDVMIVDAFTEQVLTTYHWTSFGEGQYLSWDITGHVLIKVKWIDITSSTVDNAVVSGIFFDPAPVSDAPPTVTITSPANGNKVSGVVEITATASDDIGVSQVEFFANGNLIGVDKLIGDGWSVTWDTTELTDGVFILEARATDTIGQTAISSVTVTLDNIDGPPTVSIISPINDAKVSGGVTITASADDDRGVNQVEFFANNTSIGIGSLLANNIWSITWDTTKLTDGVFILAAEATDTTDQTAISSVNVSVVNTAPKDMSCDLDGYLTPLGSKWTATVTVAVYQINSIKDPIVGAVVKGAWSGGYTGNVDGTTLSNGQVTFTTASIPKTKSSVTFTITDVTKDNYTYIPPAVKSITLQKP